MTVMNVARSAALRIAGARSLAPVDIAEWRTGWRVVAGAAVGMGTGISLYLLVASLFITHITREFGWTRGDMGVAGMVAFMTGAIALPLIGRLLDRFGFRSIVLVCVPALALLYLAVALQPGWYWFYLVLMVWGGTFGGGTGAISYTRPVIAAFEHQRGLALGAATAGTSLAAMIVPPLLGFAIVAHGWRAGLYAMVGVTLFVGLPLTLALIGRVREGAARALDDVPDAVMPSVRDMTLGEAMRRRAFWLLALALIAINVPGSGVVSQLAPLVGDKGLSDSAAALVMSAYAFGLFVGRLLTGYALDRFRPNLVGATMTLIPALGIVLLMVPSPSFALAALAVVLIGMQQGSEVDLIAYFVSRSFGLRHYGSIYGMIAMGGALSTAVALVLFGKIHDVTGTYDIALMIGAVAFCTGSVAFASIGRAHGA
jgi:MFS family permease